MAKRDKPGMKSVAEVTAEREKKQREKYRAEQAARDAAARLAGAAGRVYGAANKVAGVKTATDPITEAQRTTAAKMRQQAGNMAMHAKWADRARQTGSTGLYNEAAANYNRALDQLQQTQAAHRQSMAPSLPAGNQALLTAPRYIPGALETSIPLNQRAASYAQGEANLALGAGDAAGYADAMRRYNAAMDNIRDTVLHEGTRMDARVADARQRAAAAEEAETAQTGRVMSSGKYDMRPYYMGGGQSTGETGVKVDPTLHEQTEWANARLYAQQERQRQIASDVDAYRWGQEEQRIRTDPDLARKAELGRQRWTQERSRIREDSKWEQMASDWEAAVQGNMGGSTDVARRNGADQGMVDTMTPEHQQIYWALYSESPERAKQYAAYVGKLDTDAWFADIAEAAGRDPASRMGAFIGGTVLNLSSGQDPWGEAGQAASRLGEALIGGGGQGLQERGIFNTGLLAGTAPENWAIIGGKGLSDWYQLESSIAQSAMTAAMASELGGGALGEIYTLALMGGSAAASDYRDMLSKGADERTALLHSAAYGINEGLFEKLSLENLINADMVKPVLVTLLQSSGVEGSEEMFTSIANAIADAATAKLSGGAYQSDIDRETYRLMLGGMSAADAREQASRDMAFDIIYDGLGGAISGGLSVGGKLGLMAANNAVQNRVATNAGNRLTGMALAGSRETMAAVQQYAEDNGIRFEGQADTAADTRAAEDVAVEAMEAADTAETAESETAKPTRQERREQRQQERADRRLGESYQRVQRHVQQQLERAGSKAETMEIYNGLAEQYGEDFARAVLAPSLETAQAKVYAKAKSMDELKQLHQANVQGETDAAFVSAAEDAYEARARELAPSREEYTRARRSAAYANRQGQEIDLTVRAEDGGAQRTEVLRIDDAGRAVLADGSTHEIQDLDMDLDTKDLLATLTSRVQGEDANTILATVQDALRSGRIDNAYRALSAAITVYGQGQLGTISQAKAVAQSGLNAELATRLYQQGAQSHAEGVERAQTQRDKQLAEARERGAEAVNPAQTAPGTKRQAKRAGATGRRGSVDTSQIAGMQLSRTQQRQVGLATRIAQALGVDVEFFASEAGEDGLYSGEQGSYRDGRIRLDINAGLTQATELMQTSILNTMSHELTHYIQDYSPALYEELRQAVLDKLTGEYGEDWVQERIQEKFDRATDRISQEEAIDEVVADGCELMLRDSEAIRELYKSNRTLFDKIADWINRFLRRIREEFTGAQTREGQAMEKYLSELQGLWDKALVDAAQVQGQVGTTGAGETQHSIRSVFSSAGFAVEMQDGRLVVKDENGNRINRITSAHVRSSGLGLLVQEGVNVGTLSQREADKQVQGLTKLLNMMLDAQDGEMVWQFAGSAVFSAVRSNSDGQYGTTVDFSTVCRKTQEMMTAMSKAMVDLGRGLTKEEVTRLQKDILQAGGTVPCPVCYVFSRWAGIGGVLNNMAKFQRTYDHTWDDPAKLAARIEQLQGAKKKADLRALMLETDENYSELAAERERLESTNKQLKKDRRGIKKSDPAREAKLDEINRTIRANEVRVSQLKSEMTALENEGAPELAWLVRVRSQPDYWESGNVPNEVLFDLNNAATFAEKYKLAWGYRTSRGPSAGKAILPYSDMRLGDMILGPGKNSADGKNTFAKVSGQWDAKQLARVEAAKARAKAQNLIGGHRFQSTSDFRYDYALDYLQAFLELQAIGGKLQTYTKIVEFAEMVASIGGDVNLSVMPLNSGLDADGNLIYSDITGINKDAAMLVVRAYDSAQLILVGINDEHINAALDDTAGHGGADVGFVIPYHASGASINEFIRALVSNLNESFVQKNYKDYSPVQNDTNQPIKGASEEQVKEWLQALRDNPEDPQFAGKKPTAAQRDALYRRFGQEIRKAILTHKISGNKGAATELVENSLELIRGRNVDISDRSFDDLLDVETRALDGDRAAIAEYRSWTAGALWDLYYKMWVDDSMEDSYGVELNSSQAAAIMPHEYWDTTVDRAHAYVNGFRFRSYCYNLGLNPRFTGLASGGTKVDHGNFRENPGYWKTLIDRAMYDNQGNYRAQRAVNVTSISHNLEQAGDIRDTMLSPEYAERNWSEYKVREPDDQVARQAAQRFVDREIRDAQGTKNTATEGGKERKQERNTEPLNDAEDEMLSILAALVRKPTWNGHEFDAFYRRNPQYDFMARLMENRADGRAALKQFAAKINDVETARHLMWYTLSSYDTIRDEDIKKDVKSAKAAAERIYKARMQEIAQQNAEHTAIKLDRGEYTIDEIRGLFEQLNSDGDVGALAEKVFATAKTLGVQYYVTNQWIGRRLHSNSRNTFGISVGRNVAIRQSYLADAESSNQDKAATILHETIHTCTVYALDESYQRGARANQQVVTAAKELTQIYEQCVDSGLITGEYGASDVYEFVAELSNPKFREKIQKISLWDRIVNAIKKLFGIDPDNALDAAGKMLEHMLDNTDYVWANVRNERIEDRITTWEQLSDKERYQQRDYSRLGDEEVIARMAPESIENQETRKIVGEYKQLAKDRRTLQQTLREAKASEAALVASGGSLTESRKMQRDLQRRIDRLEERMKKKISIRLVQDLIQAKRNDPTMSAVRQLVAAERTKATKDANAHKDEVFANYKERRKATELRGRIANLRKDLVQRVLRPTDGRYVPAELGGALVDMLDTLDMRPGDGTQAAAKYDRITDALHAMRDAYAGLESNDDPTWRTEYDTDMAKELKDLQERIGDRDVRSLNVSELQAVYDAVRRIRDTLRSATKLLAHNSTATIYDRAESIVAQMRQAKPDNAITPAERRARMNRLQKLSAIRAVLYMSGSNRDSTLYKMFRDIEDGYTDSMTWVMDYNKRFTGLRTGANERTWRRATTEQQSYGLKDTSGKDVKMTRMQVMQLIMTWEREMNNDTLTHLQTGGASIRDAAAIANGKTPTSQRVRLDQATIDRLAGTLTKWERDYIAQIRDYFQNTEAPAMSRVVYALKHRALQTEDYYVPYTVDGGYLESKIGEQDALDGIWVRNPRSTQPLQNMAPQPVIIDGIDTVMRKHVSDSGNYVSLALPIRDFAKVYNARFSNADGVTTLTHTAVEEAYGSEGDKLIKSIIAEVQGQRSGNSVTTWMDQAVGKLQSSFVRAALLINPSVTIKQAASYLAAGSVISRKALSLGNRSLFSKTDQGHSIGLIEHLFVSPNGKVAQRLYEEMDRYTSIGWERRVGLNMEDNMSRNALMRKVQENISGWEESNVGHYGRKALAVVNALNWIQRMDVATTTALWVACKEQARLDGLAVGSEEYWARTTELYERVVRETQPMYDPLHRSAQQKNSKGLIPYLFQFRTVPMQNHGQLVDAMEEWRAARGTSREKESRQFFIKTVVANFESAVMFSALSFLAAALKHKTGRYRDKDDEMSVGSVLTGIGLDTASVWASNLMPLMGSEIYNMIEAGVTSLISGKSTAGNYDALSVGVVDMVNDLISAGEKIWKYSVEGIHGDPASWDEWRDALWRFGKNTAKACGIPAQTMETYIKGFVANVQDIASGRFPALNNVSVERTLSTNARRYYDAWTDGDSAKMDAVLEEIRQGYLSNGKDAGKADELTRNGISSYAIEQYKAGNMDLEELRELLEGTGLYDADKLNTKIKGLLREELDAGARDEDGTIRSLVDLAGMEEDAAWDTVRKWADTAAHGEDEDYSWGKYDEVHAAIDANRDIDQIVAELVNHGYDEKNVRNDAKRYITEQYEAGAYSEEKMRNYLSRYCGIVKREQVDEIVNNSKCYIDTGYHYKDLREAYEDSSMAAPAVEQALQRYGGLSSAEAKSRVRYWRFQADYEDSDLTEDQVSKYYDTAPDGVGRTMQQVGIKETTWIDYCQRLRDCKGTDADGDGKTDSGSKKAAIMQMINALPLTAEQKDALYYLNGWSKKTITDAPWR